MNRFIEILSQKAVSSADLVVLNPGTVTYRQLDTDSGKVYAYLKSVGIGRDDMVLICMPRSAGTIVCMIGVWKAGAAVTITEGCSFTEKIEYIREDASVKLIIDRNLFEKIMELDSLGGYEQADPHDPCFAVYTSGSTGKPKGVLHEFGKLDLLVETFPEGYSELPDGAVFGYIAPMDFVVCIFFAVGMLSSGHCVDIVPYGISRDPCHFVEYIRQNNVAALFMTPSMLKAMPQVPLSVKVIFLAGEPLNGIWLDGVKLAIGYSSSEVVISLTSFILDRPYQNAPLGPLSPDSDIRLLDGDGQEVRPGCIGEICCINRYTRGYINLPEQTKAAFYDGMYHTGDLGRVEDGLLYICGRKTEMIEIDGNRVEPLEVEIVLKSVLKTKHAAVKGWTENGSSYIAAYLLKSELSQCEFADDNGLLNENLLKERLSDYLPLYMVPTCFVVMDEFPYNDNGKLARIKLPEPIRIPSKM